MASGKLHEDTKMRPLMQGFRACFTLKTTCFFAGENTR